MIYFRNIPTAMDDLDTVEGRLRSTLEQLEIHKRQLLKSIDETMRSGESHFDSKRRMLASSNGLSIVNSLGEFQTNEMQRADILIQQAALTEEMIVQLKYVLDPTTQPTKKAKVSTNAEPRASRGVRKAAKPRKQVGKRAAVRPQRPEGR